MSDEPKFLNLHIGPKLEYDTNLDTVEEIGFWLMAFHDRLLHNLFAENGFQEPEDEQPV